MTTTKKIEFKVIDELQNNSSILIDFQVSENINTQMYCVHRALKNHLTNNRIRNANTKTRSEVRGGGKKPWKQKGTGRARAGSTRSPLWKGGGIIFGPKPKIYQSKINKKEKRLAINTLIYNKSKNTIIVNDIHLDINIPSTKKAIDSLNKVGLYKTIDKQILIIVEKKTDIINTSFRNLPNIELIESKHLNILSLLKADTILITITAMHAINRNL